MRTATPMSRPAGPDTGPRLANHLSGKVFFTRAAMASGLLGATLAMGGCLVPQDFRFSDDPPPFKNNPVTISLATPTATTLTTYNGEGGSQACSLTFTVVASDPDLDDSLTVRWYVDYDRATNPGFIREERLNNRGTAPREAESLTISLDVPGNPLFEEGNHVVEALVADGQLVDREPQPRSTDPDAGVNPSFVDRAVWIVNTQRGDCP